nr:MAG TPA: hypothetical protein [Caudoviricetes sp.]
MSSLSYIARKVSPKTKSISLIEVAVVTAAHP